ncbi:hypothetical protein PoB_005139900 [Plakobranchus ocellatus]|uniref:Uncharacterized protein n=1 Tax=Plakobranchus ocellatus TaxID=259542 RepID=A0AAV4C186_9GAST|nr:hypothetical protein PoB_005139900 [Plakobranchus ocellatus]
MSNLGSCWCEQLLKVIITVVPRKSGGTTGAALGNLVKAEGLYSQPRPTKFISSVSCQSTRQCKSQLRWAGHVFRMKDHRLPKIALYGEIRSGHRYRGAPKKRYKDCLKKTFTACNIDHRNWSDFAADRSAWRLISSKGVTLFEETRRDTIKDKRSRRKARAASAVSPDPAFSCRLCCRACRSRIGLFSHERSCRQRGHSLPS